MKGEYYCLIILVILLSVGAFSSLVSISNADTYPPNTPAFEGGFEPADIISEPLGDYYDIYFKHYDYDRVVYEPRPMETAWTIVPGHDGCVELKIVKKVGMANADCVSIDDWKDPTGGKSGITWKYNKHSYSPGQIVPFRFSVSSSAPQGVYTVYMTLYKDYWGITYSKFKVYFVVRDGADTQAPKIDVSWDPIPDSIMYGEEISIKFYLKNVGTEGARTANWVWFGNGLQIYLENGEFTRAPRLLGYIDPGSWGAYDYNDPSGRPVEGAPIIEVYDDFINIGGPEERDIIEVYIKAKEPDKPLNIKIEVWWSEPDEWLWDNDHEGCLFYRYSPNATEWPFNGEWGGTPKFDDTAASSDPIAQIFVFSPEVIIDPNGGRIFVDNEALTTKTIFNWPVGSIHVLDPDSGYQPNTETKLIFSRWNDGNTDDPRTIYISGDASYKAIWQIQYKVKIEVSPKAGGTTNPPSDTYWYDANSWITVTATPAFGYSFSHWIINGQTSYQNPVDIYIDEPYTLTAVFTENPSLTVQTTPSIDDIHFKVDGTDYYTRDGYFTVELKPGTHTVELVDVTKLEGGNMKYEFSYWSGATSGTQNPLEIEIEDDAVLTANFDIYYKVLFTQAGVEQGRHVVITVDGVEHKGYSPYTYYEWVLSGDYISFEISNIIESSLSGKRYIFDRWENGEGYTVTSPQMIDKPEVFTAYYTIEYRLEVSTVPDGLTAPQIHPLGPWYAEGTEVTCTAAQIEGYEFDYWVLDGKPQEAGDTELTVIMDSPHHVIAHYTPITTETWTFPVQIGTETYNVAIESNSTVSNFYFDEDEGALTFQVEGPSGTKGFCEVVVPTALMQNPFTVKIDEATILENYYAPTNGTHYFIQFTYIHTTHTIEIIPEFPPTTILFLTAVLTLTTIAFVKKKTIKH